MICVKCAVEMFSVSSIVLSLGAKSIKKESAWVREMECPKCGNRVKVDRK